MARADGEALAGLPSYAALRLRTDAPPGSSWGLFGPDDQVGTLNFLRLNDLRAAAREVVDGTAFSLDIPSTALERSLAPTRTPLEHHIFQRTPYHRDEWLDRFYTQYGSQVDGLRHIGHPDYGFYNGADPKRFNPGDGLLSIHHLAALPIAGRAVLLDVDRYLQGQGRPINHQSSHGVSRRDLEGTCASQGTDVRPGDVVLIRFGWWHWYRTQAPRDLKAQLSNQIVHPGLEQSHEIVEWLWDRKVSLVAGDNFALERWPASTTSPFHSSRDGREGGEDPHAGIMHRALIALLGMPIGELWDLDALAQACAQDHRWSFLLTVAPLTIVGGVGSPANAIALR